jgi:hypothetical protein
MTCGKYMPSYTKNINLDFHIHIESQMVDHVFMSNPWHHANLQPMFTVYAIWWITCSCPILGIMKNHNRLLVVVN